MPKVVLFYRRFLAFSGGHFKVAEYFDHVRSNPAYEARIFVDPPSAADDLWDGPREATYRPDMADILFLAGRDWDNVPDGLEERVPVVNLIQGLRHADPSDCRYSWLSRRATRICVSPEVADAIKETGRCNGPVYAMPTSVNIPQSTPVMQRPIDVFIAGLKSPALAIAVGKILQDHKINVVVQTSQIPRADFMAALARARIVVTLPFLEEGFFLPALEAMAAGCVVICPDAVGNRGFCIEGQTCLMPKRDPIAISDAVMRLMTDPHLRDHLQMGAHTMVENHQKSFERRALMNVLNGLSPRNIILTGLPRSGTTLACNLLGSLPNVVALHEPMKPMQLGDMNPEIFAKHLVSFFDEQRTAILKNNQAVSKSVGGRVPRNPLGDEDQFGQRHHLVDGTSISVENVFSDKFDLCIKHPALFTARLPELANQFDCFAFVRNPLSVLLSWRNSGMSVMSGRSFAAEAHDPILAEKLSKLPNVLDRQFMLLDYMFGRYRDIIPQRTIRYEDVVETGGVALSAIVKGAADLNEKLSSRNIRSLATDPQTLEIAKRLLNSDLACWHFYRPEDVTSLLSSR